MARISPDEEELIGEWVSTPEGVRGDAVCQRIARLTDGYLELIGVGGGGYEHLYRDPEDGRYWLHTYPKGEMQGLGPPALIHLAISEEEAKSRFIPRAEWNRRVDEEQRKRGIRWIDKDGNTIDPPKD